MEYMDKKANRLHIFLWLTLGLGTHSASIWAATSSVGGTAGYISPSLSSSTTPYPQPAPSDRQGNANNASMGAMLGAGMSFATCGFMLTQAMNTPDPQLKALYTMMGTQSCGQAGQDMNNSQQNGQAAAAASPNTNPTGQTQLPSTSLDGSSSQMGNPIYSGYTSPSTNNPTSSLSTGNGTSTPNLASSNTLGQSTNPGTITNSANTNNGSNGSTPLSLIPNNASNTAASNLGNANNGSGAMGGMGGMMGGMPFGMGMPNGQLGSSSLSDSTNSPQGTQSQRAALTQLAQTANQALDSTNSMSESDKPTGNKNFAGFLTNMNASQAGTPPEMSEASLFAQNSPGQLVSPLSTTGGDKNHSHTQNIFQFASDQYHTLAYQAGSIKKTAPPVTF